MNIPVTIPQLFYDLIARVLPGFLFLFMLRISLSGSGFSLKAFELLPSTTSMGVLLNGAGYLILCYFTGWFLRAISFLGFNHMLSQFSQRTPDKQDELSLYMKYHMVRLKNEAIGARLVKLRAEVRMLEASRTGMCLMLLIWGILTLFTNLSWVTVYTQSNSIWLFRFLIPAVLALAFNRCLRPAFERYVGNVEKHYEMLCKNKK